MPIARLSDTFTTFDSKLNPSMRPALKQCQAVASGEAWCALLAGGYGNGKTHLAIAAMQAFGQNRSFFWKVPDFLEWVRERAYGDDKIPVDTLLRSYRDEHFLLVLDDLGAENATDWASEQVYRVLDSRYDLSLPTIITTNQSPDRIDPRIRSRFRAGLIACRGADIRAAR